MKAVRQPSLRRPEGRTWLSRFATLLTVPVAISFGAPVTAQEAAIEACSDGRVSVIFVDNHSVFDTDDFGEDRRFRWAYDLANWLHVRTRQDFIRSELLLGPGDCYDPLRVDESGRLLREYSFISDADVFGLRQPDGNWHIVVDTTDEWTTEVNVRITYDEDLEFRGANVTEENLLGRGVILGAFITQKDDRRDIGGLLGSPRLLGARLDGFVTAGNTRVGDFFENQLIYPFVGEIGRFAGRQIYNRREDRFTYWAPGGTAVLLPVDIETFDLSVARRFGEPGDLTLIGLGIGHHSLSFPGYPGSVGITDDRNFDEPEPADPEIAELLRSQTLFGSLTHLNVLFGLRNVRHIQRRGLDSPTGLHDVPVGFDAGFTVGYGLNGSSPEGADTHDLYTRARLFGGFEAGALVANLHGSIEGRRILSDSEASGWRDLITEVDGLLYLQPDALGSHTFFARGSLSGGWRPDLPLQLTLGGPEGVRGYREEHFPGARRLVFSVEDRIRIAWPRTDLFDIGFTLLADVGRIWAGTVPFGADSGWRGAVGGGLQLAFPAGRRGGVRIDLAFPMDGTVGAGPILRVSLLDLLGIERVLQDRQLQRSRINTIGPDLFNSRLSIF